MRPAGIFCLEGEWSNDLGDRTSVEPQLTMLHNMGYCSGVIHRNVAGRDDLRFYTQRWLQKKYVRYSLGYFAFHGDQGCIRLGRDDLTLAELSEVLGRRAEGRIIYFGSCGTLAAPDHELQGFCRSTGIRAIVGYTRWVDWLETAAFDFILLPQLLEAAYVKPIYTRLLKDHARFVTGLGFRMATATWATPRKVALEASG
jgi:hypothetical protein